MNSPKSVKRLGRFLHSLADWQAAVGALLTVLVAGVAVGAGGIRVYSDIHDTPARVEALSDTMQARFATINADVSELRDTMEALRAGQREQTANGDLLLCMVRAMYRDEPIDAMSCRATNEQE